MGESEEQGIATERRSSESAAERKRKRRARRFKKFQERTKAFRSGALLAVGVGLLHFFLLPGPIGFNLEHFAMDTWFLLRGRRAPTSQVIIVSVDERTYEELDVSTLKPFPRESMAKTLERIAEFSPKAVMIDYAYREPLDAEIDARLAASMGRSRTYLASLIEKVERMSPSGRMEQKLNHINSAELFRAGATGLFPSNVVTHDVVRYFFTPLPEQEGLVTPWPEIVFEEPAKHDIFGGGDYINYYGPPGSLPTISLYEVLQKPDEELRAALEGRFVFVGRQLFLTYQARQTDTFLTPYTTPMAGVEIHATVVSNLLDGSWLRRLPVLTENNLYLMLAGFLSYVIMNLSPVGGLILVLSCALVWAVGSYVAFTYFYFFIPGVLLTLVILPIVYAIVSIRYHYRTKQLERAIGLSSQ